MTQAPESVSPEGGAPDWTASARWMEEDRAPARATVYWVLMAVLVAGAVLLRGEVQIGSARFLHPATEAAAAALALVLGALAFVRYYTGRTRPYLFIGTGFVAAGILDLTHGFISSQALLGLSATEPVDAAAWSWFQSRLFLALFLLISLLSVREGDPGGVKRVTARRFIALAVVLTLATVAFLLLVSFQGTNAIRPDAVVPRPQEVVPGLLFAAVFAGYLVRGEWRTDVFEHWLVIALLISAMTHLTFMGFSHAPGDTLHMAAHLLKIASYVALLIGLLSSIYSTSSREHAALGTIRRINATLEEQVRIRSQAESVLQRSEERLQAFLDGAHDLIQSTDPQGNLLYVNSAWLDAFGYSESDVDDLRLQDVVHPAEQSRVAEHFRRVLAGDRMPRIEVDFLTADGRVMTCSGSVTRYAADGHASAVQGIFRDVSAQRRAERELASSQANLQAVVESTGDPIWSIDNEQRLVTMNTAFALGIEARTGREPRPGDPVFEVFPEEDVEWYREVQARALAGERFSELREELLGGESRFMEIFGQPVQEVGGVAGAVLFGRDVTRRIRAEEGLRAAKDEAEAANRAKSHFLASMSHELRTPLNSVIGFANVLLKNRRGNLGEQDIGFLERILANGKHLLLLINQVLDLAKVEAGRMDLDLEEVDPGELVRDTVRQLEGQAREKNVHLTYAVPDGVETIETDAAKLRQVLINLVGNALKFSEGESVEVRIEADEEGRPSAIAVRDTGIGIPEARLEAIFEAFRQAESTTSRRYGGTGLGLAISQSLCELLGYRLEVESEEGEGSTFTVRLEPPSGAGGTSARDRGGPAAGRGSDRGVEAAAVAIAGAAARAREAFDTSGTDFHVLVVDHQEASRARLARLLDEFGCSVELAGTLEEGLDRGRTRRPDLVILDVDDPDLEGPGALASFKDDDALHEVPVVVVSARAAHEQSRLLGAVDIVTKPVARDAVLRLLWRHVVRRRGGRVLVVEDDEDTRMLLREHLEEAGLEVTTAENGDEAIHAVGRDVPDAILLDLMMPVMNGMSFLARLRENPYTRGLPVVVLTARDLTGDEERYLSAAASSVIRKGDDVEQELHRVLGTILPV